MTGVNMIQHRRLEGAREFAHLAEVFRASRSSHRKISHITRPDIGNLGPVSSLDSASMPPVGTFVGTYPPLHLQVLLIEVEIRVVLLLLLLGRCLTHERLVAVILLWLLG